MINNVDTQYSKDIINSAIDEGKLVATLGATLDNIIRETSIAPLMSSLGILDKEDMAELVESLISITHLNRRITMSEEGVGGPIDVAIISKGDGFVWKKRKHYFKPELNQMFLIIILGVKGMVNILNLAEVQEQKQIDEITKCIVDSLINEVEKSLSKTKIER